MSRQDIRLVDTNTRFRQREDKYVKAFKSQYKDMHACKVTKSIHKQEKKTAPVQESKAVNFTDNVWESITNKPSFPKTVIVIENNNDAGIVLFGSYDDMESGTPAQLLMMTCAEFVKSYKERH